MTRRKNPALCTDAIVVRDGKLLLILRKNPPFEGKWALPGGFVEYGETVEEAAARELREETGLSAVEGELLGVYSDPRRDPRCHTVSVVYVIEADGKLKAGDDAAKAQFHPLRKLPKLAFDHDAIVKDYLECSK